MNQAMLKLSAQPGTLFIGQGVEFDGVSMHADLEGVPQCCRLEFPIAEELNVGFATGLAMMGYMPIVVIPRMDFLLRAMDQLVNHLDKIEEMSRGQWCPKVIIRTRVGPKTPINAGPQHTQNYVDAFRLMLTNVDVYELQRQADIMPAYTDAIESKRSSLVVEAF